MAGSLGNASQFAVSSLFASLNLNSSLKRINLGRTKPNLAQLCFAFLTISDRLCARNP